MFRLTLCQAPTRLVAAGLAPAIASAGEGAVSAALQSAGCFQPSEDQRTQIISPLFSTRPPAARSSACSLHSSAMGAMPTPADAFGSSKGGEELFNRQAREGCHHCARAVAACPPSTIWVLAHLPAPADPSTAVPFPQADLVIGDVWNRLESGLRRAEGEAFDFEVGEGSL